MPDVFISHAAEDSEAAKALAKRVQAAGLAVFLDVISIAPGEKWKEKIRQQLQGSSVLLFLATRSSVKSAYVNQELGMAMAMGIQVVPIIWEIPPEELPGWVKDYQAILLSGQRIMDVQQQISKLIGNVVAKKNQKSQDNQNQLAIVLLAVGAALLILHGSKGGT